MLAAAGAAALGVGRSNGLKGSTTFAAPGAFGPAARAGMCRGAAATAGAAPIAAGAAAEAEPFEAEGAEGPKGLNGSKDTGGGTCVAAAGVAAADMELGRALAEGGAERGCGVMALLADVEEAAGATGVP